MVHVSHTVLVTVIMTCLPCRFTSAVLKQGPANTCIKKKRGEVAAAFATDVRADSATEVFALQLHVRLLGVACDPDGLVSNQTIFALC